MKFINYIIPILLINACTAGTYNRTSDTNYHRAKSLFDQSVVTAGSEEKHKLRVEIISISPDSEYGLFARAWLDEKNGSYKSALALYDEAIHMNSREHIFYYNRSLLLMKHYNITGTKESMQKSENDLNMCIELDPSYSNAWFSRAEIRNLKNDFSGAISDYSSAIRYNPSDSEAYYNRGLVKLKLKDYRGALADSGMAVKFNPEFAAAYCLRGMALYHLGRKKEACGDYRKAGSIDPDSCIFGGEDGIINDCAD